MTNYLDPTVNTDVAQVNTLGGDLLQLAVDAMYSILLWGVSFVTDNFGIILILIVLGFVATFSMHKLAKRKAQSAMKV